MAVHPCWKIVLIDDEADIREVMAIALQDAGFTIATAADGVAGLQLCEDTLPQIVITDIRMPGIDGLQVLKTIKKKYPDIEVIVATAFGEMDLAIRALQLDASDFITKPISDEALDLALKRAMVRFTSRKQLKDYTALLEKEKAETSQELLKSIAFQRNLIEARWMVSWAAMTVTPSLFITTAWKSCSAFPSRKFCIRGPSNSFSRPKRWPTLEMNCRAIPMAVKTG